MTSAIADIPQAQAVHLAQAHPSGDVALVKALVAVVAVPDAFAERAARALAVAINLAGWGALIKGLALLAIPNQRMADAYQAMGLVRFFYAWMGIILALGLWMTVLSFSA